MTYKMIAAAFALSFGLGTAAIAQVAVSPPAEGEETWDPALNEMFFTDDTRTVLRSEDEIRTNWASLSAEQQAMVRTNCDATTASTLTKPGEASTDANAMTDLCDVIGDM